MTRKMKKWKLQAQEQGGIFAEWRFPGYEIEPAFTTDASFSCALCVTRSVSLTARLWTVDLDSDSESFLVCKFLANRLIRGDAAIDFKLNNKVWKLIATFVSYHSVCWLHTSVSWLIGPAPGRWTMRILHLRLNAVSASDSAGHWYT